ncbi:MAG TPA: M20/M25/M40 family metallo-hydrolase [Anaerolineae bacterium]
MALYRSFVLLPLLLLLGTGCSLLQPPPAPSTPTPVPTALPLALQLAANRSREPVTDPTNDLVPAVDPEIVFLVENVSKQSLMGYVQTLESFGTRNTFSETELDDFGIGAARRWIFNEFLRVGNGRLQVENQEYSFSFLGLTTTQYNIIATLPGTGNHPGVLVMMANYDSRADDWLDGDSLAPGADDNGSGVAALLEIARLMSSRTWNQTIIFAALTAEEQGTFGSRYFVGDAFLDGLTVHAAINNDMIGGRTAIPQSVRLFAADLYTSNNGQLARYIDYVGGLYLPTFPVDMIDGLDRVGRWGDHREFLRAGYPAVRLIESEEDLSIQNSTRDTWQLIDYDYLRKVVRLNLVALANMVGAPPASTFPIVAPTSDPGSFLVTWTPAPEAAGYAISVRPLRSERFPPFRFVSAAQAGNVILSGFDPQTTYAVSIAALDQRGRLGLFSSPELIIEPTP